MEKVNGQVRFTPLLFMLGGEIVSVQNRDLWELDATTFGNSHMKSAVPATFAFSNPIPTNRKKFPNVFSMAWHSLKLPVMPYNSLIIRSLRHSVFGLRRLDSSARSCSDPVASPNQPATS
jgi:hypothetical protein